MTSPLWWHSHDVTGCMTFAVYITSLAKYIIVRPVRPFTTISNQYSLVSEVIEIGGINELIYDRPNMFMLLNFFVVIVPSATSNVLHNE